MDYLVSESINASFDKKNLKRLQEIEKFKPDVKYKIYFAIDKIIENLKAKKSFDFVKPQHLLEYK